MNAPPTAAAADPDVHPASAPADAGVAELPSAVADPDVHPASAPADAGVVEVPSAVAEPDVHPAPADMGVAEVLSAQAAGTPLEPATTSLASAEFLAVDVETNGRAGDDCELTDVGAVLVGGGELHDTYESLVRVSAPLSRGIERLTGITQAMLDGAPAPETVLAHLGELLAGRVLVAHSASFDRRVLAQAFARAGLDWPDPPVICTLALARRFAPLATRRRLVPLAESLGVEPRGAHRALVDADTCARIFCALFRRLCAHATTLADALELVSPRRRAPRRRPARRRPPDERPSGLATLPTSPGVYVFRDVRGRPLYVGKSVSVRSRARAHFCAPAGWTERAETVDYVETASELGALVLENRLIKRWRPPGNVRLKRSDGYVYVRARLDIAYPILEVAPEPGAGHCVNVGPLRGRDAATELVEQLTSLFSLRHCGRRLPRRDFPSAYGQMGRCLSPCLGDLDPNLYRRRLDDALAAFTLPDARARLLATLDAQLASACADHHYERAAVLVRRRERLERVLSRVGGLLEAVAARSRLVVAGHPSEPRFDAFWLAAGRVVDWGPLAAPDARVADRTRAALERIPARRAAAMLVGPEEVDEIRIVHSWLAAHEPPQLELQADLAPAAVASWVDAVTA